MVFKLSNFCAEIRKDFVRMKIKPVAARKFPLRQIVEDEDKSKDFFDDAAMEHVRHNLFQLSSVEGMIMGGPPSAITFHSTVVGRRVDSTGKLNVLLRWNPEDILPDTWIPETEVSSNLEKTIPFSKLPPQAFQLPSMVALGKTGMVSRPGKRKRK